MKTKLFDKTIFKYSRNTLISALFWAIIASVFVCLSVVWFRPIAKVISTLPQFVKVYFGGLDNIYDFFEMQVVRVWIIFAGIYGVVLAYKLVICSLKGKTSELTYTLPLSRTQVIATKALRLFVNLTIMNLIISIAGGVTLRVSGANFNAYNYILMCVLIWLTTLILSYTIFGIALTTQVKFNGFVCALFTAALYIFSVFAASEKTLGYFTPISFVGGGVLTNGISSIGYQGITLAIWVTICVITNCVGAFKFKNADIC